LKAILGATLIDGTGAEPQPGVTVLIDGERILAAGPERGVSIPRDAERIAADGLTLLPGLIDAHTHVTLDGSADPLSWTQWSAPYEAILGMANARRLLEAGFTTVRDMGARGYADVAVKQAIERGLAPGSRVLTSGHMLTGTGGHADDHLRPEIAYRHDGVADGPDGFARAARLQLKHGADVIKLMVTGGVLSDLGRPGDVQLSPEEIAAAVAVAHRAGRRAAAHAQGLEGIKAALRAGVDSIEHGCYLDEEAVATMVARGVYLVPTLSAGHAIVHRGPAGGIPAYALRKAEDMWEHHQQSFRLALQAGVPIALGTDCGIPFNYAGQNAFELQLMVGQGMTPLQAIAAATGQAAACLGLADHLGTVAPGRFADLLLVDGDPLADVSLLADAGRRVMVFKAGVRYVLRA
jgi:imidazolonepropionase-like amidohydrolase